MSSATLLLSGSLVASGLVLGAFTLHGAFDPPHRQVRAAGQHASDPKAVNTFQTTTRSAVGEGTQTAKPGAKPDAKPADTADAQVATAKAAARRRLAEKRRAEKAEKEKAAKVKQEAQQATLQWPWNWKLFGN